MYINNNWYGLLLILFSVSIGFVSAYYFYKKFIKKGKTSSVSQKYSGIIGGIFSFIIFLIGIKAPLYVVLICFLVVLVLGIPFIYIFFYIKEKIQK